MESITTLTPQQAADALGVEIPELARTISTWAQDHLVSLATKIERFEIESLEEFDDEVAAARRHFESLLAFWKLIDAASEGEDEATA